MIHSDYSLCIICSELFLGFTHAQKANLTFSDVSVWMRHFWKTLENASVDGERFKTKMPFSNTSGLMYT